MAKQAATLLQAQKDQTSQIVRQLADDMVQNISAIKAWCVLLASDLRVLALHLSGVAPRQESVQMQVNTLDQCQVILHKPIYVAPKFEPGGCDPPKLIPGNPPTYTKATPGTWCASCMARHGMRFDADASGVHDARTPGRAAYFTPGYWTPEVKPQWVPGTPASYNPGTKGAMQMRALSALR